MIILMPIRFGVKDFGLGKFSIKRIGEKAYGLGFTGLSVSAPVGSA